MSRFDEIIQQKANDHEAYVPNDAWDNIAGKKDKRRYGFFWWMAAVLVVGSLIGGYYYLKNVENGEKVKNVQRVQKVENVEKVNEADKIVKEGKDGLTKVDTDGKVIKEEKPQLEIPGNAVNPVDKNNNSTSLATNTNIDKKKNKSLVPGNVNDVITENKKQQSSPDKIARNRVVKKKDGKAAISIQQPETAEAANSDKKDIPVITSKETIVNADEKNMVAADKKQTVDELNKTLTEPVIAKKDLAVDSSPTKKLATAPDENKKEKTAAKKQTGKHPWFIDVSVMPLAVMQEYDHSASFNRTLFFQDGKSDFAGKLNNTRIDPSVAFSIGVRKSFNKKLSLGIGLRYLQLKEHISIEGKQTNTVYKYREWLIDHINGSPAMVRDTIGITLEGKKNIDATNGYRFLSIPVSLQYNFMQKHSWSMGIAAGLNINIYSSYRNEVNRNAKGPLLNDAHSATDKTGAGFSLFAGLRFGKMINKRTELFVLPSFSYSPSEQHIKNNLLDKKIHQAGVSLGISFKLK